MDVFDLAAKITLDKSDYEKGLNEAGSKLSAFGSKVASGIGTAMKVGAAAVGAAATAVGGLAMKSVQAYSEYEQMVGGVNKLYGNMGMSLEEYAKSQGKTAAEVKTQWETLGKAQDMVLKNAQNAYKTAGMSANKYMSIATSFSAALINSLNGDTVKAAEATDKAMTAIADNWNTFGGDIGMIQGAFQGFAKQNYTMLDNLKLGYGGTKKEMERLIADANEYAKTIGEASDLSINSFADIVTAIDLVQQKQQIAGTTAREASTTIQGSLGMVKAAWENLMIGMSDGNANLDQMMNNLVDSIAGYTDKTGQHVNGLIDNILPVVEKALESVATLIEKLAPKIAEELPKLIETVLPTLISAGAEIIGALVQGLAQAAPALLETGFTILETLLSGILENSDSESETTMSELFSKLVEICQKHLPTILEQGKQILSNIVNGIIEKLPDLIQLGGELLLKFADAIIENLPSIIETGFQMIATIDEGLAEALPELIPKAVEIILTLVESLIDNIDKLIDVAIEMIMALADGLIEALPKLLEKAPVIIEKLVDAIIRNVPKLVVAAGELVAKLVVGIIQNLPKVLEAGMEIVNSIQTGIISLLAKMWDAGKQAIEKIREGIHSINPIEWGRDMIDSFIQGIKDRISKVKEAAEDIAGTIKGILGFSEPDEGPLSNFHTYAPDMMNLFIKGIKDNEKRLQDQVAKSFDFGDITMKTTPTVSAKGGMAGTNNMTINVYGAEGQDVRELADIVQDRILHMMNQTGAVYA